MKTSKLVGLPTQIQQVVSKEWWPTLTETGLAVRYKKNSHIVHAGERDKYVRLGLSGWFALQRGDIVLGLLSNAMQTNALGKELAVAMADLIALTEVSAVLLDSQKFTEALMNSPPSGLLTVLKWAQRNMDMVCAFGAIRGQPLNIGLAALFWTLGEPVANGRRKVPTDIPGYALARALGVSREEISRKRKMLKSIGTLLIEGDEEYMSATTPMLLASAGF